MKSLIMLKVIGLRFGVESVSINCIVRLMLFLLGNASYFKVII